jgi:hypothetical protein
MKLEGIWQHLCKKGLNIEYLLSRSLLSPATCCLVNQDGGQTVAKAFAMLNHLSRSLREKYRLS